MKKLLGEFKEFINRGNVIDLSVAVIIGGAFQAIVKALVDNILSPVIGLFAKTDFSNLSIKIWDVEILYGAFITAVINFLIMAFVIFLLVKALNTIKNLGKKEEATVEEKTTKKCPFCCSEIAIEATRCPHCTSEIPEE